MILWQRSRSLEGQLMRLRAARVTFGVVASIAIGISAFFLIQSEQRIAGARAVLRTFDRQGGEAIDALAEVRAGQQAYVAAGQGIAFWMPKVAARLDAARATIVALGREAASGNTHAALEEASSAIDQFAGADARARDYLKSDQPLMAADVIFTEGGEDAASAARLVEAARLAEHQAADALEATLRRQEALALGATAGVIAFVLLLLVPLPGTGTTRAIAPTGVAESGELMLREPPRPAASRQSASRSEVSAASASGHAASPVLKAAAELCADFSRIVDINGLALVLGKAAHVMDAGGLIVWLGTPSGGDLRAMLAHGYTDQALARLPPVPRSGHNAAAAAYRTGRMQIVVSRPGSPVGAVVAPIVGAEGCIGALSAEISNGGESSDAVQALATIFAAQLAGILAAGAEAANASSAAANGN